MAKHFCRKCGKIISDVDAFCPKCGVPTELSMGPQYIGGRPVAMVRVSNRRASKDSDLRAADRGRSLKNVESQLNRSHTAHMKNSKKAGDSQLTHSHTGRGKHSDKASDARLTHSHKDQRRGQQRQAGQAPGQFQTTDQAGQAAASAAVKKKPHPVRNFAVFIAVIMILGQLLPAIYETIEEIPDIIFSQENEYDELELTDDGTAAMSVIRYQMENRYYNYGDKIPSQMEPAAVRDEFIQLLEEEIGQIEAYEDIDVGGQSADYYFRSYLSGLRTQHYALTQCQPESEEYYENWTYGYYDRVESMIYLMYMECIPYDQDIYEKYYALMDEFHSQSDQYGYWVVPDSML